MESKEFRPIREISEHRAQKLGRVKHLQSKEIITDMEKEELRTLEEELGTEDNSDGGK